MRSRFSASATSMMSASPRVPIRLKDCSRWSVAKSSQAARNSCLSAARTSVCRRRQAGSTFRNVYFTKWRSGNFTKDSHGAPCRFAAPRPAGTADTMKVMRIALVSPYSWTYPGGVTRHIEALSEELLRQGHDVRVLSPFDQPDQLSARLHRGVRPMERETPEGFVDLGRTVGYKSNGSISNMASFPTTVAKLRTA